MMEQCLAQGAIRLGHKPALLGRTELHPSRAKLVASPIRLMPVASKRAPTFFLKPYISN